MRAYVHIGAEVALLFFLILLSAYCSCSETALTAVSHGRLVYLIKAHPRRARALGRLLDAPNDLITALLVLNNVVNVTASSVMTLIIVQSLPTLGAGWQGLIATGVMTVSLLVLGEITPKSFAKHNAEGITLRVVGQVHIIALVLRPIIRFFQAVARGIFRIFGIDLAEREPPGVSDEQIETLIDASEESGLLTEEDGDMIRRILDFDEVTAEQVMVPRTDVQAIEVGTPIDEVRLLVSKDGHSRFPVYDGVPDNVVGTLYAKDLLAEPEDGGRTLRDLVRPAFYAPTLQPINVLLRDLQRQKVHMAVVIDEFGGMAGIVTLEDILEEIVGEIEDEYDSPVTVVRVVGPGEAIVSGDASIHDVNRELEIRLPEEDAVTVNGLFQRNLEAMAQVGDAIDVGDVRLIVEDATEREITSVRVVVGAARAGASATADA
ncbi:MAG: hemolysin family protein [Candidatus Bipolaricaulota bacterium]